METYFPAPPMSLDTPALRALGMSGHREIRAKARTRIRLSIHLLTQALEMSGKECHFDQKHDAKQLSAIGIT